MTTRAALTPALPWQRAYPYVARIYEEGEPGTDIYVGFDYPASSVREEGAWTYFVDTHGVDLEVDTIVELLERVPTNKRESTQRSFDEALSWAEEQMMMDEAQDGRES